MLGLLHREGGLVWGLGGCWVFLGGEGGEGRTGCAEGEEREEEKEEGC